jgi:hypothetical protein
MGIDYGLGQTNIDVANGIRYGVIPQYECLQACADSSEPQYPELEESEESGDCDCDCDCDCEPIGFVLDDEEYLATQGYDDCDIFILKSPYYTLCDHCSPCAPGAGYLMSPGSVKAYCFGHDFFEDGKAPYRVFRVDTDEEVLARV